MNQFMGFDPYLNRERNEQIRKEVESLRLEGRLRRERNPRGPRLAALVERARLLAGGARLREADDSR